MYKIIPFLLIFVIVVLVGWYFSPQNNILKNGDDAVACTMEALICPDGSAVGRTGPNCEFAKCPVSNEVATITKTFFDASSTIKFSYPDNFYIDGKLAEYIRPVEWPPQVVATSTSYSCKTSATGVTEFGKVEIRNVLGKNYCVTTLSEGAAGSVYTTYSYKNPIKGKTVTLSFMVRTPQCGNFDEPKKSECEQEKKVFSIDELANNIFKSVEFVVGK